MWMANLFNHGVRTIFDKLIPTFNVEEISCTPIIHGCLTLCDSREYIMIYTWGRETI